MKAENIILADEIAELSAFIELARERGLLMRGLVVNQETLQIAVNSILDAIEECAAIVQAIRLIPIEPGKQNITASAIPIDSNI